MLILNLSTSLVSNSQFTMTVLRFSVESISKISASFFIPFSWMQTGSFISYSIYQSSFISTRIAVKSPTLTSLNVFLIKGLSMLYIYLSILLISVSSTTFKLTLGAGILVISSTFRMKSSSKILLYTCVSNSSPQNRSFTLIG